MNYTDHLAISWLKNQKTSLLKFQGIKFVARINKYITTKTEKIYCVTMSITQKKKSMKCCNGEFHEFIHSISLYEQSYLFQRVPSLLTQSEIDIRSRVRDSLSTAETSLLQMCNQLTCLEQVSQHRTFFGQDQSL